MKGLLATLICCSLLFAGCNKAKQKAKEAINKSGEVVGKTVGEASKGVAKGIEECFASHVQLSDELRAKGIELGKIKKSSTDSSRDNILNVYIIFNQDFNDTIMIKILDEEQLETGRTKLGVKGNANDASYFSFVFDKRTHINANSSILIGTY